MLTEKTIGVLMGGTSAEREVSLMSGNAILRALTGLGYIVKPVDVGADICEVLKREKIELAFLALHGGTGEDGSIQGMLEVLGIPYTGSGVLASAMAMNKLASKKAFIYHGLKVPEFEVLVAGAVPSMSPPFVVKPVSEGSSIGVNIVNDADEVGEALKAAFSYGGEVLVEKYIKAKEVNIGVIAGRAVGGVEVRPKLEFYSYKAKYTSGMTEYILPPELSDDLYSRAMSVGLKAHQGIGARGATRVDLLIDDSDDIYVLEVNTIPGMTETSLLPKIAGLGGMDFPALVEEILRETLGGREA